MPVHALNSQDVGKNFCVTHCIVKQRPFWFMRIRMCSCVVTVRCLEDAKEGFLIKENTEKLCMA